jgi:hypothetical protein
VRVLSTYQTELGTPVIRSAGAMRRSTAGPEVSQ